MQESVRSALADLRLLFRNTLQSKKLTIDLTWPISEKTIAEIGGRLVEDYILSELPRSVEMNKNQYSGSFDNCTVPKSQRAMEDISFKWKSGSLKFELLLLVDVKGHNETKKGSRPNLASIRKCIELYENSEHETKELVIFYCRYKPIITKTDIGSRVAYLILDSSFDVNGIFLIRNLSESNLDPADIGSGGQILLAREDHIVIIERNRHDFVTILRDLSKYIVKLREKRGEKRRQ